ncbi:MAG: DnaJ domain-containing protein [Clostridia bacterium]|nr:hypothetical protein [Clostridiales bacterium]MBQ3505431.1 DnaJ domain-containing protein [Clostridia bacterium]
MNEYYELLGVNENATDEEITAQYEKLKEKYKEERWQDGEAGNEAARMLNKIDVAYREILSARKEQSQNTDGKDVYEEIADLLKAGDMSKAQARLDDCNERSAEWHYLQAVVFYKKNWTSESKKQLEIAMEMDPDNIKYRNAYGKLNAKNDYQRQSAYDTQNPYARQAPVDEPQMGGGFCDACAQCCFINLCANCLLNMCCCH